jgi:hypothetical protein
LLNHPASQAHPKSTSFKVPLADLRMLSTCAMLQPPSYESHNIEAQPRPVCDYTDYTLQRNMCVRMRALYKLRSMFLPPCLQVTVDNISPVQEASCRQHFPHQARRAGLRERQRKQPLQDQLARIPGVQLNNLKSG